MKERNNQIVKLKSDGLTHRELAAKFGISISRISQIINRALWKEWRAEREKREENAVKFQLGTTPPWTPPRGGEITLINWEAEAEFLPIKFQGVL